MCLNKGTKGPKGSKTLTFKSLAFSLAVRFGSMPSLRSMSSEIFDRSSFLPRFSLNFPLSSTSIIASSGYSSSTAVGKKTDIQ